MHGTCSRRRTSCSTSWIKRASAFAEGGRCRGRYRHAWVAVFRQVARRPMRSLIGMPMRLLTRQLKDEDQRAWKACATPFTGDSAGPKYWKDVSAWISKTRRNCSSSGSSRFAKAQASRAPDASSRSPLCRVVPVRAVACAISLDVHDQAREQRAGLVEFGHAEDAQGATEPRADGLQALRSWLSRLRRTVSRRRVRQ